MNFVKTMNTMPNAGMSLERGKLPEKSVTGGMSDTEFDRWVEQLVGPKVQAAREDFVGGSSWKNPLLSILRQNSSSQGRPAPHTTVPKALFSTLRAGSLLLILWPRHQ